MNPDRQWWLRVPAVFLSPHSVFVALRNEEDDDVDARQEPILALIYLAGMAGVLATSTAGTLLDDTEYDSLLVAVWVVIAGGIYGVAGYFIIGGAVYLGARGLGGVGSYRRARHILGFAAAPLALSLFLVWPLQLAVLGSDVFRTGARTTVQPISSSTRSSSASRSGRPRSCSSASGPSTAGAGCARSG